MSPSGTVGGGGERPGHWSVERAQAWWAGQPWRVGCNFIPSTAINQIEMWQAESFDLPTIERELGWAADLGLNVVRVYLHDLLWDRDARGFRQRIDGFLEAAHGRCIAVVFVLFDDVWSPEPRLGPQPDPHPGRHNSGWVQSPGLPALRAYPEEPALRVRLERYVRGVLSAFGEDERVLVWDLYNEPGGYPSPREEPVGEACLPLLRDVFEWAREVAPRQLLLPRPLAEARREIGVCGLERAHPRGLPARGWLLDRIERNSPSSRAGERASPYSPGATGFPSRGGGCSMGVRSLLIVALLGVVAAPAAARNSDLLLSAKGAAESEKGRAYLLDVPFYLKGESHPAVVKSISEMSSNQSASGAFRGDEPSCNSAFLAALKVLQTRAQESGADAIVDVVSVTRGQTTESATDFRCVAGAVVVHVGLKGKLVKLK